MMKKDMHYVCPYLVNDEEKEKLEKINYFGLWNVLHLHFHLKIFTAI
jgi:hypothetical protein